MLVHKGGKIKNWGGECRDVTPTKLQSQNIFKESTWGVGLGGIRVVSPVGRFAGSFRPGSFRPCFRGGSFRPYWVSRFARGSFRP